jgi:hypothetical protein
MIGCFCGRYKRTSFRAKHEDIACDLMCYVGELGTSFPMLVHELVQNISFGYAKESTSLQLL